MKTNKRNTYLFWIFAVVLAVVKQYLVYDLPIYAVTEERALVELAESLKAGQWNTVFGEPELVKYIGYPLFLAMGSGLPFSYLSISSVFYTISALCMVYAVKPVLKTYKSMTVLYAVLLFCPVSFSLLTFQKVGAGSIVSAQVLLTIGSFLGIYFRREWPMVRQLPWLLGAILGLVSLCYTVESAVFVLPFVMIITVVTLVLVFIRFWTFHKVELAARIVMILLPLIAVFGAAKGIEYLNEYYADIEIEEETEGQEVESKSGKSVSETLGAMWELHVYASSYQEMYSMASYSEDDGRAGIQKFENITKNKAFCAKSGRVEAAGWCDSSAAVSLTVRDANGSPVLAVERDANDRFEFVIENDAYTGTLQLYGYDEKGVMVLCYALSSGEQCFEDQEEILKFDYCYVQPDHSAHVVKIAPKLGLLNKIESYYAMTGPYLFLAGLAAFGYVTVRMVQGIKRDQRHLEIWLMLAGIFFSYLLFLGINARTSVPVQDVKNAASLSAAYPLIVSFWCMGIHRVIKDVLDRIPNNF